MQAGRSPAWPLARAAAWSRAGSCLAQARGGGEHMSKHPMPLCAPSTVQLSPGALLGSLIFGFMGVAALLLCLQLPPGPRQWEGTAQPFITVCSCFHLGLAVFPAVCSSHTRRLRSQLGQPALPSLTQPLPHHRLGWTHVTACVRLGLCASGPNPVLGMHTWAVVPVALLGLGFPRGLRKPSPLLCPTRACSFPLLSPRWGRTQVSGLP